MNVHQSLRVSGCRRHLVTDIIAHDTLRPWIDFQSGDQVLLMIIHPGQFQAPGSSALVFALFSTAFRLSNSE